MNITSSPSSIQLVAYALPGLGFALVTVPVYAILPTLYVQNAQISLSAIGVVLLLRSIYDAISDQIIGFLSDRTRTRLGARLPWIIAGTVVTLISMVFLFRIPEDSGVAYFAFWTVVFFTGTTMFSIPHYAWGHELSLHYTDRNRVFGFKGFFDNSGSMLFSLIPLALVAMGLLDNAEYAIDTLWMLGTIVAILLPLQIFIAAKYAPRGAITNKQRTSARGVWLSVKNNKPFQRFILAYVIAGTGYGFFVALLYPFISTYLLIPDAFASILLVTTIAGLCSIPIWIRLTAILGKHRAWAWGWLLNSLVLIPFFWIEPGPTAVLPSYILMALYAITNGVSAIAPFSILGDVIDYDILKTRIDRGGNYYAFMMFAVKALGSTGGLALIVLGSVFGYDLSESHENTDFANMGILVMFAIAPGIFQLATLPLIWNFPIDARRHAIIRRRLDLREHRENPV